MPLSPAGVLSSTSTASNRSRNRPRYRTKALSSEVDESLFGGIKPLNQSDSPIVLLRDKHAIRKTLTALGLDHKPDTIQLITRDMVRELIIPTKDPSGESLIMSPEEFERIRWASHVPTREELEAKEQAFKKEKEAIVDAVTTRKKIMKQKEMVSRNNQKLSDLEEVAKERAQNLLQRANQLRMEQEEELKDMKKIILNAKCHAIRDAQILEKQLIQKELDAEEKRLDQMMEVERQKSIQRQEELDKKRREERIRGRRHIVEQMEKNQEERSLLAEQREQEKEQMLEYMEQLQEEDLRDLERRHQQKLKMQAEIKRINDENQKQKAELLAQEKLADQMVMEFTKKKMAREAEFEAEQERIRREKEKEISRLRALQEKVQDYQAEQHNLAARDIRGASQCWLAQSLKMPCGPSATRRLQTGSGAERKRKMHRRRWKPRPNCGKVGWNRWHSRSTVWLFRCNGTGMSSRGFFGLRESRLRRSSRRRRRRPWGACSTPMSSGAKCVRTSRSRCRTGSPSSRRASASKRRPRSGVSTSRASRRKRLRS
ncbi:cilia- and flagella-associated protein 45 isoform X2 [Phacochoerus africanus]|uniref:cilia- and flagella-associated protein 45 isoform X2 n=1 Tax=Phacochoerus africanus TaxID=41426 RepID=UPI001FD89B17|nr:cilia- and flagella-associated protein 45 isoform X2 [Phacochoerus africanus]